MSVPLSAVHTRAAAAAKRNGSTGELASLEPNDTPTPTTGWRKYFGEWEENLTMPSGRTIEKGWVVPQPLGIGLIILVFSAVFGMAGWAYKSSTADNRETRDAIIRMETMLNERTRVFDQQQAELTRKLEDEIKLAGMYRDAEKDKRRDMMAALKQKGIEVNE